VNRQSVKGEDNDDGDLVNSCGVRNFRLGHSPGATKIPQWGTGANASRESGDLLGRGLGLYQTARSFPKVPPHTHRQAFEICPFVPQNSKQINATASMLHSLGLSDIFGAKPEPMSVVAIAC